MYYIYKATFENGKVYIGITNNFERRLKEHKKNRKKKGKEDYAIYRAINKYGWESIEWEIIEQVETKEEAKEKEIGHIAEYDSYNRGGYNTTKGGDYPSKILYKLDDKQEEEVIELLKENKLTMQEIADKFEVSISKISTVYTRNKQKEKGLMKREKKARRGSANGAAKLDEKQVSEIKQKLIDGVPRKQLKDEYGVSKSLIQMIAVGTWWRHVEPKIPMKKKITKMTKEKVEYVKSELERGRTGASIMKELKMSPSTMAKLKKGEYDCLLEE